MEVFKMFLIRGLIAAVLWIVVYFLASADLGGWALLVGIGALAMTVYTFASLFSGT